MRNRVYRVVESKAMSARHAATVIRNSASAGWPISFIDRVFSTGSDAEHIAYAKGDLHKSEKTLEI